MYLESINVTNWLVSVNTLIEHGRSCVRIVETGLRFRINESFTPIVY